MKKGNVTYLRFIVIIFVLLWIPYFQNVGATDPGIISFFNMKFTFVGIYPILLFLGVLEGALIILYIRTLIIDITKQEPQKFDL